MFLISIPVMAAWWLFALTCLGIAFASDRGSRGVKASAMLVFLAPLAYLSTTKLHDTVKYAGWAILHQAALASADSKDVIITSWESWDDLGSDNESYLVSDKFDDSRTPSSAELWRTRMGISCEIVGAARMQRGIYILTTNNCSLDGGDVPDA